MISLNRKEECCGCTACASVCPKTCISMQTDLEGFKYPVVNINQCIRCHKCEKVCPVINPPDCGTDLPEAYLSRTKDEELRTECTSGGVFTSIAKKILVQGGIAYGVIYDDDFNVIHSRISRISEISKLPGSKYVQSDMGTIMRQVKLDIGSGKEVVFCGTPCQVAGLRNYLGKKYNNLCLVDLVCHGVPSPLLWENYREYLNKKHGKLCYVNFRSKKLGYHVSVMEERFDNGKSQVGSARTNLMSKCFFQNVADRPICYECPFKTISRCSDITIFDGWHASEYINGLVDDDKGYTIILVHSIKGKLFINGDSIITSSKIDLEKAIDLDGKMAINSVTKPEARDVFYDLLNKEGIEDTVKRLFPIKRMDYLIEGAKLLAKKTHLLGMIKKSVSYFKNLRIR